MRPPIFEVVQGDVRDVLASFPAESVHAAVTSPPYFALRDYEGNPKQIGLEPTFDEWVATMVDVFRAVRRVLRKDGTLWLNIGKSYAGTRSFEGKTDGTDGVFNRRKTRLGSLADPESSWLGDGATGRRYDARTGHQPGFKPMDLIMQGHIVAEALRKDGWWLRSDCVWWKNAMPESVESRPANTHENVFLLTKSRNYFFDMEAVRTPTKDPRTTGHVFGGKQRAEELALGGVNGDTVRKTGNAYSSSSSNLRTVWDESNGPTDEFLESLWAEFLEFAAERMSELPDVWKVNNEPFPGSHFAVFSTKLVERCVKASTPEKGVCPTCFAPWRRIVTKGAPDLEHRRACGSDENGAYLGESTKDHDAAGVQDASAVKARILEGMRTRTSRWEQGCACPAAEPVPALVLDPFSGTGRTGKAALALGRDYVGVELVASYAEMSRKSLADPDWEKKERARIRAERKANAPPS